MTNNYVEPSRKLYTLIIIALLATINSLPYLISEKTFDLEINRFDLVDSQYNPDNYSPPLHKVFLTFDAEFEVFNRGGFKINKLYSCPPPRDIFVSAFNESEGQEIDSFDFYNFAKCDAGGYRGFDIVAPFTSFTISLEMEFYFPIGNYSIYFDYNRISGCGDIHFIELEVISLDPLEVDYTAVIQTTI